MSATRRTGWSSAPLPESGSSQNLPTRFLRPSTPTMNSKIILALRCFTASLALPVLGLAAPNPDVFLQVTTLYPNSLSISNASCFMCHEDAQGNQPWNGYGWGIRQNINGGMTIAQAILAMEPLDSDGDPGGSTNLEEIMSDSQPGWTEGSNNTVHFINGSTTSGVTAPAGISGDLDPSSTIGTSYCSSAPNSAGAGAELTASGSTSVQADDVTLQVTGAVAGQFGLVYYGSNQISVSFGDGTRCVGGSTIRLGPPQPATASGEYSRVLSPLNEGFIGGQTVNFQYWYRDPGGPGGTGYNLSGGLELRFTP